MTALTVRPATAADGDAVLDVMEAAAVVDGTGPVYRERFRRWMLNERPGFARAARVWERGDRTVGFAIVLREIEAAEAAADGWADLRPEARGGAVEDELGSSLREMAVGLSRGGPLTLRVHARDRQTWKTVMLGRAGFALDRSFHRMSRDLAVPIPATEVPEGYAVRPLAGDHEVAAWCAAATAGFAGHYDAPVFREDDRRRTMATAEYESSVDLVAVDSSGDIVGVSWSFLEGLPDGSRRGNVNYVAVVPAHRGQGLARALVVESLRRLRGLGLADAFLVVDSANDTPALRLYESAGFVPVDMSLVYIARVYVSAPVP